LAPARPERERHETESLGERKKMPINVVLIKGRDTYRRDLEKDRCDNCAVWDDGICRLHPPVVVRVKRHEYETIDSLQPWTVAGDWCNDIIYIEKEKKDEM
jgi:hypothetical protein